MNTDYKKWKRNNVTIRGMKDAGTQNNAGSFIGKGLYTAPLSNKQLAKQYGKIYFVVNAVPKKPKVFQTLNDWEIWFYNNLVFVHSKANGKDFPDVRDFDKNTTIENEMIKLGYDGVIIKGREMVNYTPTDIKYFETENELQTYYENLVLKKEYKQGGVIETDEQKKLYAEWKNLVNMTQDELQAYYDSEDGKTSGLSKNEAATLKIKRGRDSAKWILKMKDTPVAGWTLEMWEWADRQVRFIKRMRGVNGKLYDENKNKTRKHKALLIWGHNPEKYAKGGLIKRADGTYSKRGLWDNIRANIGSGKKPTPQMLKQAKLIKLKYNEGGAIEEGISVEKEHKQLYEKIKKALAKKGIKMPVTEQEFFKEIAQAHIDENPQYYKLLKKYVEKARGGSTLLAPNGKPSNLTPEQYKLVRTPEFKAWFGDWENDPQNASKVIDENGEPLVVYHGTQKTFNEFQKTKYDGWYFFTADIEEADNYGENIISCFLKVLNPNPERYNLQNAIQKKYLKNDYDGAFQGGWDISDFRIIIVKNPSQIKLADGTNVTFDGTNPDIRFAAGGSTLLAPNGKPSNLTPEQYKLVRTPEFKSWFGDWENDPQNASKVIDENGEPLVVYHSSNNNFNNFKTRIKTSTIQGTSIGSYFSNSEKESKRYGKLVKAFFLNIKKPIDFTDIPESSGKNGIKTFLDRLPISESYKHNIWYNSYHPIAYKILENAQKKEKILTILKKQQIDGFIYFENEPNITFVCFNPSQIKLADGTNVTFDGTNPDIRFTAGGSTLFAPNGKPSNLTPEQYKLVRTPEFKAWFGDWETDPQNASKVVDENGEPLVVYHGTLQKFNVFKTYFDNGTYHGKGAYFTSSLKDLRTNYVTNKDDIYLECFLNLTNPLIVGKKSESTYFERKDREIILQQLRYYKFPRVNYAYEKSYDSDILEKIVREEFRESKSGELLNSIYRELGFSGIIFLSPNKLKGHTAPLKTNHFVAFKPTQIKLADGTNTTFDGNNPDIRFTAGGSTLLAPNGKPSNLTPEQYKLVRTPEFKAWFGDWENDPQNASKVIDENGEPLVVYHGTQKTFNEFQKTKYDGWYFFTADIEEADNYGENIISCFLKVLNPNPERYNLQNAIQKKYLKNDYDGAFQGGWDISDFRIIIVKNPSQIKLSDGTNTTFNSESNDIRFEEGGEISREQYFDLQKAVNVNQLEQNINYILSQYGNRKMASTQVEKYLNENTELAKQWLLKNSIKTIEELKIFLDKKQVKQRKVVHKERSMATKEYDIAKAELALHKIEKLALEADTDMQNKISNLSNGGDVSENEIVLWHGGNLEEDYDAISHKKGRYEYGAGLYLTSHKETARKYAKGNRKLYRITIDKGVEIHDAVLDIKKAHDFINKYVIGSKKKEIKERLSKYVKEDGTVKAFYLNNIILNENAITSTNSKNLRLFLVENGIDYEVVDNAFGWGETMYVLYNMKKIINKEIVDKSKYQNGGYIKTDFNNYKNKELAQSLLSLWNDFISTEIANYLDVKKENYVLTDYDSLFIIFRDKDNFTDIEKVKINNWLKPYFSENLKPLIAKYLDGYYIEENKIFIKLKKEYLYNNGGEILIAPNGNPSNLTPEQYRLVRTPEFKAWFGDWENDPQNASKVVDENGEPLVVWHGSNSEFNIFGEGKNKHITEEYKDDYEYRKKVSYFHKNKEYTETFGSKYGGHEKPYFLDIRNIELLDEDTVEDIGYWKNIYDTYVILKSLDGIYSKSGQYVTLLNPHQIKLADGTNVTFDGTNPDIRYTEGGNVYTSVGIEGYLVGKSRNPYIGKEVEVKSETPNVRIYKRPDDTDYRFIYTVSNKPVSVLHVDVKYNSIQNAYTLPKYRNKGIGTKLYGVVKSYFPTIKFSTNLSESGKAFKQKVQK